MISYTTRSARDLVYTHSNLRLMKQIEAVDYVETTVEWEQWAPSDKDSESDLI